LSPRINRRLRSFREPRVVSSALRQRQRRDLLVVDHSPIAFKWGLLARFSQSWTFASPDDRGVPRCDFTTSAGTVASYSGLLQFGRRSQSVNASRSRRSGCPSCACLSTWRASRSTVVLGYPGRVCRTTVFAADDGSRFVGV